MIAITDSVMFLMFDGMALESYAYWLAFVISGICGLLLAWLSTKNITGGSLVVAGWTGFETGVALANLLYFQMQSIVVFWLIIGITSLIIVMIVATNINYHMIWITAIFGAYLFMISMSLFVGRWPIDLNLPKL